MVSMMLTEKMRLVPSTTDGHYHLYIDRPMHWYQFVLLLWALRLCYVIEMGCFWWSLRRGATFVRVPDHPKTEDESMKYTYGMFFKLRQR